jgi:signal transduction histidine kinase
MVLGPAPDPPGRCRRYRRDVPGKPASGQSECQECLSEVLPRLSQGLLAVTSQLQVRDVLQVIVRSARSLVEARYAALGVPDNAGSFAEFIVDGVSERQRAAIGPLPRQHGMLGVLLREAKPLRLDDIRSDPRFEGWPSAHPELTGFIGVPVMNGSEVLGIIFAANKRSAGGFTERDSELLALFAAHAAIALTNARLYERARELSAIQERSRLARDLHDAVAQKLFSIRAKAAAAAVLVGRDPLRAVAEMESVARLTGEAHTELRAVIDGLAPADLVSDGLAESVRRYAVLAAAAVGMRACFAAQPLPELDAGRQAVIYRVAQEAVSNAVRHSAAAEVCVHLTAQRRSVLLEVADRGRGFTADAPSPGLGLASMRERAAAIGGRLAVQSEPGAGTVIRLSVPVNGSRRAGQGQRRPARRAAAARTGRP